MQSAVRRFRIVRHRVESSERILHTESIAECLISSGAPVEHGRTLPLPPHAVPPSACTVRAPQNSPRWMIDFLCANRLGVRLGIRLGVRLSVRLGVRLDVRLGVRLGAHLVGRLSVRLDVRKRFQLI